MKKKIGLLAEHLFTVLIRKTIHNEVYTGEHKNKRVSSMHFESDTLPATSWWRYNFDSQ